MKKYAITFTDGRSQTVEADSYGISRGWIEFYRHADQGETIQINTGLGWTQLKRSAETIASFSEYRTVSVVEVS